MKIFGQKLTVGRVLAYITSVFTLSTVGYMGMINLTLLW